MGIFFRKRRGKKMRVLTANRKLYLGDYKLVLLEFLSHVAAAMQLMHNPIHDKFFVT
jgi:hypothetical protein